MRSAGPPWQLTGFIDHLDDWIDRDGPTQDLRVIVTDWVISRAVDPYQGAEREPLLPNLWFAQVPGSYNGPGTIVVCAYVIEEATRTVRCSDISTLRWPG